MWSCPWLNVVVYLCVCLWLLGSIVHRLHGHFSYSVDDAYIHLALTERIAHGLYGINAGEPSSPASSILWPFLFVPFAGSRLLLYMPLVVNMAAGSGVAWLLGRVVQQLTQQATPSMRPQVLSVLLLFALNLFGLTFLGLEHPLEVLLAVSAAYGLLALLEDRSPPRWTLLAAGLIPCIRYEGLLITAAVVVALLLSGRWKTALVLLPASVVPLLAFGIFLHHLGLPFAPMSVLMKSPTVYLGGPRIVVLLRVAWQSLRLHMHDPERYAMLLLTLTLGYLAWQNAHVRSIRGVAAAGTFACVVQMLVGPYGWFFRYEIYCLGFGIVLALGISLRGQGSSITGVNHSPVASHPPRVQLIPGALLVSVAALALFYFTSTAAIQQTATAVYQQQAQMGRFTRDFYHGPVAVHDLGWIAVGRTPNQNVLDLAGLGSYDAFRAHHNMDQTAIARLAEQHQVGLAILNPSWFGSAVPTNWQPLAKLCAVSPADDFALVSDRVVFYATPRSDRKALLQSLAAFQKTLPPSIPFQLGPQSVSNSCDPSHGE